MVDVKNKLHSHTKKEKLNQLSNNCHYLTEKNYNKSINIDRVNEYTVLKIPKNHADQFAHYRICQE